MAECCTGGTVLLYSCSGASDLGEISDRVARKAAKQKLGGMTCLAAVGAHLSGFVESAKGASDNITIDGCSVACSKKVLEHIGVSAKSYILTEMGFKKGKTPPSEKVVNKILKKILNDSGDKQKRNSGKEENCSC